MIWPPIKAWTSKFLIEGQAYFVAINYGGELLDRWVILMSVLDSNVVIKVSWSELVDPSDWESGWDENIYLKSSKLVDKTVHKKGKIRTTKYFYPSADSGLTIPITKDIIRPWFGNM